MNIAIKPETEDSERAKKIIKSIGKLFERGRPIIFDTGALFYNPEKDSESRSLVDIVREITHPQHLESSIDLINAYGDYIGGLISILDTKQDFFIVNGVYYEFKNGCIRLKQALSNLSKHNILNRNKKSFKQAIETLKRVYKRNLNLKKRISKRVQNSLDGYNEVIFSKTYKCLRDFETGCGIKRRKRKYDSETDEEIAAFAIYLAGIHKKNPIVLTNDAHVRDLIEFFKGAVYIDKEFVKEKNSPFFRFKMKIDCFNCLNSESKYKGSLTAVRDTSGLSSQGKEYIRERILTLNELIKENRF